MNLLSFSFIMAGVALNTVAQLCLKQGMLSIGSADMNANALVEMAMKAILNPFIIIGMLCYVTSFAVWLIVLSRVEVSLAYPMLSIGYIVTAIVGYYFWGESLGVTKIVGIILICSGVAVMFR